LPEYRDEPGEVAADVVAGGPSPTVRTIVRLLALSAIGATLFVFHGISMHLTPWSQAIINGIVKYAYPTTGQDDTTVVLFRERNLRELNEAYPVSYDRHADVLEALSLYGPRAVFVDFAFVDRRPDLDRLRQVMCGLREAGVAVYLAVPAAAADRNDDRTDVLPELRACATPVSAQMDTEQGVSGVLTYSNGHRVGTGGQFLPTPAFAVAAGNLRIDPLHAQPMEIIWGNGVAPLNEKWMHCQSARPLTHLWHILRHDPMAERLKCPYTRTLSVGHLLGAAGVGGASGDMDIRRAIEGRAVFYGAAFQLTGDRVLSPVFDELPGVYLHAMAYDNLRTFGGNYKRADRPLGQFGGRRVSLAGVVDTLLLLATVTMLLVVEEPPETMRKVRERLSGPRGALQWLALALAVGLVVAAVARPTYLTASFLGLPLMLAAVAALHLAAPSEGATDGLRGFVTQHAMTAFVAVGALGLFFAVDDRLGLEAALLLVVIPGYFLYKVLVLRDVLFVATAMLLVVASLVSFLPPINLGPRNVIAYVAFFEVARHLLVRADESARKYFRLRDAHRHARRTRRGERLFTACDWWFAVCVRREQKGEGGHAGTAATT
jgi:hypothetical protein